APPSRRLADVGHPSGRHRDHARPAPQLRRPATHLRPELGTDDGRDDRAGLRHARLLPRDALTSARAAGWVLRGRRPLGHVSAAGARGGQTRPDAVMRGRSTNVRRPGLAAQTTGIALTAAIAVATSAPSR